MNGYVVTWMAVSATGAGLPALAAGILLGRRAEHSNAYGAGQIMGKYEAEKGQSATEALEQMRREAARRKPHPPITDHPHFCKPSCWS